MKTPLSQSHRPIPFVGQADPLDGRCAAAALCMVLRSFEIACTPEELWPEVSLRHEHGRRGATRLVGRAARQRGLAALAIHCAGVEPITKALGADLCVIVNFRLALSSSLGHYAVVLALAPEHVVLHDPLVGPRRRLGLGEFRLLWQARRRGAETAGAIAIGIGRQPADARDVCDMCQRPVPSTAVCPACREPFPLEPWPILDCAARDCPRRRWRSVHCPHCDAPVDDVSTALGSPAGPTARSSA